MLAVLAALLGLAKVPVVHIALLELVKPLLALEVVEKASRLESLLPVQSEKRAESRRGSSSSTESVGSRPGGGGRH